jgi:hypothetical protein
MFSNGSRTPAGQPLVTGRDAPGRTQKSWSDSVPKRKLQTDHAANRHLRTTGKKYRYKERKKVKVKGKKEHCMN